MVLAATHDDIAYYAKRRCADEHDRAIFYHVAEASPRGAFVAKDEGTPIGIAFAHEMEDEWFISELFVEPSFREGGVGHELLAQAARDAGQVTRSGLLDPAEVGGLAFFARRGVAIQTPVLSIAGTIPREEDLARMAAGDYRFSTAPIEPVAHGQALGAIDREIRGTARIADHEFLCRSGLGTAFFLRDEFIGYSYVWPSGRIGPLCAVSPAYLVQLFGYSLAQLARTFGASWCTLLVPGTNVRLVRATMRAGLTINGVRLFASDGGTSDFSRYVGFHRLVF